MNSIKEILSKNNNSIISIYGIGTETETYLRKNGTDLEIVGLLDGFRESGEIYGYPIIPLSETLEKGVNLIIVIARPGSCKAITKRIGGFCREHEIAVVDVRGRDLLEQQNVSYDFHNLQGESRQKLEEQICNVDVVSFDLFDTLVMRKVRSYTDVFELMDLRLRAKGIVIADFAKERLFAEKELSKGNAPELKEIYQFVLEHLRSVCISASELAELEWKLDSSLLTVREEMREIFRYAIANGKKVVVTTDTYYSRVQISQILEKLGLKGYDDLLVSCKCGTSKTQNLFGVLKEKYNSDRILHIGDDEFADIEKAEKYGINTFRIYSASDLFDALGGLGLEEHLTSLADRVKAGLFSVRLFHSPFWFDTTERQVTATDASDIGYLFCAPMITDFMLWLQNTVKEERFHHILFGARDGYLPEQLFRLLDDDTPATYFLTSRTAAIRAGMESAQDITYVDSMKYSGTPEAALKKRFGIEVEDVSKMDKNALILEKAEKQRENYKRYMEKTGTDVKADMVFFDFVAKGTTQLYLQKLFAGHMKGLYFLQLEPEFMADKGMDIEPFYTEAERESSAIYENYYILETMLTAPYPQVLEFDAEGAPVYAAETRSEQDLRCFERAQKGILDFFKDYIEILPESARTENKKLDEKMLALINKIRIQDEDFLSLKVEDPFFGRMTDMRDVIG